jgi:diacylglycerol kinase (ATP)
MPDSKRIIVIVNRKAARARKAWPRIADYLTREGVVFDAHEAGERNETENVTRRALREGYETVAVVGGDGTLSETARGFFEFTEKEIFTPPAPINPKASLAILPAGTGDDFARGLMGRRASLDEWLARLTAYCHRKDERGVRTVDVLWARTTDALTAGSVRSFVCLNAATIGIGAEVAASVAAQSEFLRRAPGELRFALAAVVALKRWRERKVTIRIEENSFECATNLIAVTNGTHAGGGMNFSPEARLNDGMLDVVTACGISRGELLRELPRVYRGAHVSNPKVRIARGARIRIETGKPEDAMPIEADGDVRGHTPVEFQIMPAALRVIG